MDLLLSIYVVLVTMAWQISAQKPVYRDVDVLGLRLMGLPEITLPNEDNHPLAEVVKALQGISINKEGMIGAFNEHLSAADSSGTCITDITYLFSLLNDSNPADQAQKSIALQYADAMTKIPHGLLRGKWLWEGSSSQCKKVQPIINKQTNTSFIGSYMSAELLLNGKPFLQTYPLVIGVCVPSTCSEEETEVVLTLGLDFVLKYFKIPQLNLTIIEVVSSEMPKLNSSAIATITIIGIIVLTVALGTLIDYLVLDESTSVVRLVNDHDQFTHNEPNEQSGLLSGEDLNDRIQSASHDKSHCVNFLKVFRAFSIKSNASKLFGTKTADGPLACLNGLRVLSMWWVILGHTFAFVTTAVENPFDAFDVIKRFTFQPIINGTFSVDTFFFLSGLLVAYLTIKEILEKGKLNWVYFFIHRYWRLTPLLAFVILFYTNMFPYIVYGPFQFFTSTFNDMTDGCRTYWWSNLLYINNFYPYYGSLSKTCIGWTWYLANDMQFYIFISPFVIMTFTRKKILGFLLCGLIILQCVITRGALVLYYGIHGLEQAATKHINDPMAQNGPLYGRPYARCSVYIVGMLTGYILAVKKNRIHMNRFVALIGWMMAVAIGMLVIYGQYYYNHHIDEYPKPQMSLVASMFYVSLSRTAWSVSLAWVVIACVAQKGGIVRDVLSWKIWAPLGRLTYAAYLVHPITIYFFYMNQERLMMLTVLNMVYAYLGNLVVAYGVAFIVSMGVEAPMIQLEKLIIQGLKSIIMSFRASRQTSYRAF